MRVGVLGTGMVGRALAGAIAGLGHDVMVGTRAVGAAMARTDPGRGGSPSFPEWLAGQTGVRVGTFAEAAGHGEVLFNATAGEVSLEAAGAANLAGKILVDVANPLDFSHGMPPALTVCNTDSLAEQIQRAHPQARVVKTLNTVTASVMVAPGTVGDGEHHAFVAGDDEAARSEVTRMLREWFGWKHVLDLGDLTGARAAEMYLPMWLRLFGAVGTPMLNVRVVSQG
jgi:8-hydroxy-5-deazaflavin:NADPH oxidoreductase